MPGRKHLATPVVLVGVLAAGVAAAVVAWRRWKPQTVLPTPQMRILTITNQFTNGRPGVAMVTGASSGIGAAFARRLASEGYNLILVARREERLRSLADDLKRQYAVDAEILVADLALSADVDRIVQRAEQCDTLRVLINNAGFGRFGHFVHVPIEKHLAMISVHVLASVRLCRAALPSMIARGRGTIINVSSIAAFMPRPGNVTYNATKMYLKTFTEALHAELVDTGVQVQVLFPGLTSTEFFERPEIGTERVNVPSFLWMTSEEVVEESLRYLSDGKVICVPGLKNRILLALLRNPVLLTVTRVLLRYRSSRMSAAAT